MGTSRGVVNVFVDEMYVGGRKEEERRKGKPLLVDLQKPPILKFRLSRTSGED